MNRFTVVYDACVLYPAPLRDLLMRLALTDLYRARWSDQIHEEWITAVLRNRPEVAFAVNLSSIPPRGLLAFFSALNLKADDRIRTGDVQLGKLTFYH